MPALVQSKTSGYDATKNTGRRNVQLVNLGAEHDVLKQRDRDKLQSTTRDLKRNAPDVGWAIRKHLDAVTTFEFQCKSGDDGLDDQVESLMDWWSRPLNCDISGRFSFDQLMRMGENLAITDGDCFYSKLSDGRIQIFEGDRVRNPNDAGDYENDIDLNDYVQGVEVSPSGKPQTFLVCERTGTGPNDFKLLAVMPAQYMYHYGIFDRIDQVRGISQMASSVNVFRDIYEARNYALNKAKISQLAVLKYKQAANVESGIDDLYGGPVDGTTTPLPTGTLTATCHLPQAQQSTSAIDLNARGMQMAELATDEDLSIVESQTPSTEFQNFVSGSTQLAIKSLDLPYSFYAENYSTYSGSRQAMLQYDQSCDHKRDRQILLRNALTVWRIKLWIADGTLELPDGWTIDQIKFEWVPQALPWIDPQKESVGWQNAVGLRVASRQQICKSQGRDWFQVMDELAAEKKYADGLGIDVDAATPTAKSSPAQIDTGDE